jgi:hypothetical protein
MSSLGTARTLSAQREAPAHPVHRQSWPSAPAEGALARRLCCSRCVIAIASPRRVVDLNIHVPNASGTGHQLAAARGVRDPQAYFRAAYASPEVYVGGKRLARTYEIRTVARRPGLSEATDGVSRRIFIVGHRSGGPPRAAAAPPCRSRVPLVHGARGWPRCMSLEPLPSVPTFRTRRSDPASATRQLDFVFASRALHGRLHVAALNAPEEWGPSDHCRVLIEFA